MKSNSTSSRVAMLLSFLMGIQVGNAGQRPDLIVAIRQGRNGDSAEIKELVRRDGPVAARDEHGNTALHWAALANNVRWVVRLLEAGADARVTNNAGATALHYGVGSDAIVRLLLKAGADPNVRSAAGGTPMHSAAARPESFAVVKRLLAAGAEVDPVRRPDNPFDGRDTPLSLAALAGDERTVKLLLDHGASPGLASDPARQDMPKSPVAAAAFSGRERILRMLVARGGSVNCDDGFAGHALNIASYTGHRHLMSFILEQADVDVHRRSPFGEAVPPMVWTGYDETGDATLARVLLARGVDVNEASSAGSTALRWASKRGETPLVAFLRAQGAKDEWTGVKQKTIPNNAVPDGPAAREHMVRDGVQRAVALLQRSSDGFLDNGFVKRASCVSCHQQTLPAVTFALAQERGFQLDDASLGRQLSVQQSGWSRTRDRAYELHAPQPAPAAVIGYGLHGLHALRYEPDDLTAAMSYYLAETQLPDGSWPDYDFRPPMEAGPIVGTALTLKALQFYPPAVLSQPLKKRIQKAHRYLQRSRPINLSQQVFRYHGMSWAGATAAELRAETAELLALQRADGGWAPLPGLESDSWATGHTLVALHEAGGLATSDPAYQSGVEFLLRTQFQDGSWWVKSRTWPFQPHFDSQFPHGKDQWISAGGTAWAAMALLLTLEPASPQPPSVTGQQRIALAVAKQVRAVKEVRSAGAPEGSIDFSRDIRPILERSCVACHSGAKPKGGYSLSTRDSALKGGQSGEPAIVAGELDRSALIRFVQDQVEDLEMPPLSKRAKFPALSQEEIKKLGRWIAEGATWPDAVILGSQEK